MLYRTTFTRNMRLVSGRQWLISASLLLVVGILLIQHQVTSINVPVAPLPSMFNSNGQDLGKKPDAASVAQALKMLQVYEHEFKKLKSQVLSFIEIDDHGDVLSEATPSVSSTSPPSSGSSTQQTPPTFHDLPEAFRKKLDAFDKQYRFETAKVADAAKNQHGAKTKADAQATDKGSSGSWMDAPYLQDTGFFDFPNGGEGFHYVPSQFHHPPPPPLAPPPPPPPPLYGATNLNDFGSLSNFKPAGTTGSTGSTGQFKETKVNVDASSSSSSSDTAPRPPPFPHDLPMQGSVLSNARKMRFGELGDVVDDHKAHTSSPSTPVQAPVAPPASAGEATPTTLRRRQSPKHNHQQSLASH